MASYLESAIDRAVGRTLEFIKGMNSRLIAPALLLCCAISQPASAHHGWSLYQSDISLTGTVSEVNFGNAHDEIVVVDEEGRAWAVLLAPPQRNRPRGFDESAIGVDDVVTLHGERHYKEEVFEIKTERIERDGEEIYRYPGR